MQTKKATPASIDEYIANFPEDIQDILERIRRIVHEIAPGAQEKISSQMPTFTLHGNLVHFAAFQKHIGFYPTPSGTERFKKEIASYKAAKGSIQFPLDRPIPYELITKIVKFRVQENLAKAKKQK